MNKGVKIFLLCIILLIILIFFVYIYNNFNKEKPQSNNVVNELNYNINKISEEANHINTETELSSFSTSLFGDENRLENIRISCNTINEKIIKNGETFSFNEIVGKPSSDKGYKEADIIIGTKLEKGLGGGNCQVSTTLYNACLEIPDIEIIERHPHKRKVSYIEEGKDASVSYGTLDLKFKNNTGNSIKILMNSNDNKITAKIVKIQT